MKRLVLGSLISLFFIACGPQSADELGDSADAVTASFTQTDRNQTFVDDQNQFPCTGDFGTMSETFSDTIHVTQHANGSYWSFAQTHGTYTFASNDPSMPSYTGTFTTTWGTAQQQVALSHTETFVYTAQGSDGSHYVIHGNAHLTMNPNNKVTVAFDNFSCN